MFRYVKNLIGIKEKTELENASIGLARVSETSEIAFVVMAESGAIDEVTATEHMDIFTPWVSGMSYVVDNLRTYGTGEQKLYRCVQAHTSQDDWTPDVTPALWALVGDPAVEYPEWAQPLGAHDAYGLGAKVTYNNQKWVSVVDGNIWVPGVYGWEVVSDE